MVVCVNMYFHTYIYKFNYKIMFINEHVTVLGFPAKYVGFQTLLLNNSDQYHWHLSYYYKLNWF